MEIKKEQNLPKSARDILLSKVGEFVVQATQKKAKGDDDDALSLYQRSAEILIALISSMHRLQH